MSGDFEKSTNFDCLKVLEFLFNDNFFSWMCQIHISINKYQNHLILDLLYHLKVKKVILSNILCMTYFSTEKWENIYFWFHFHLYYNPKLKNNNKAKEPLKPGALCWWEDGVFPM